MPSNKEYKIIHKEQLLEKAREYKRLHKEELKVKAKIYNELNKDKIKERRKKYRATPEYKEIAKKHDKKYYITHKEKHLEKCRTYYKQNKEQIGNYIRKWKKENADKVRIYNMTERARKRNACIDGEKITREDINNLLKEQDNKCFYCGNILEKYHIDHYYPLSKNGKHTKRNLRIACPTCNLEKHAKMPEEFIKQLKVA